MALAVQKQKALSQMEKAEQKLKKIKEQEEKEEALKQAKEQKALEEQASKSLSKYSKWMSKNLGTQRVKVGRGQYETVSVTPLMAAMEVTAIENYLSNFKWIKSVIIGWYADADEFHDFAVYLEVNDKTKVTIREFIYFEGYMTNRFVNNPPLFPWNTHGDPNEIGIEEINGKSYIRIWWD